MESFERQKLMNKETRSTFASLFPCSIIHVSIFFFHSHQLHFMLLSMLLNVPLFTCRSAFGKTLNEDMLDHVLFIQDSHFRNYLTTSAPHPMMPEAFLHPTHAFDLFKVNTSVIYQNYQLLGGECPQINTRSNLIRG